MKVAAVRPGMYRASPREGQASTLLLATLRRLAATAALPAALTLYLQGGTLFGMVALIVLGALWRQGWRAQGEGGARSDALRAAVVLGSTASFNLLFFGAFRELAGAVLLLTALGVALQQARATQDARARRVEVAIVLGASALTLALFQPHLPWMQLAWAAPWLAAALLAPVREWLGARVLE